jgi:hypothetical protein
MVFVPIDGKGNAFAFLQGEQETAEKKIKREAKRNPADYQIVPLNKLALDQYGNIVAPATKTPGTLTEPRQRRGQGLPAPGDRPGHLPQLQEHRRYHPREGPLRRRPDRKIFPQRGHAAEFHLPLARV